jgi:hypothetical protein
MSTRRARVGPLTRCGAAPKLLSAPRPTGSASLERSYSFAIEDLEDEGPKPAVDERVRARALAPARRRQQLRAA